jgi:hypothetical protein
MPSRIDEKIASLDKVHEERFRSIGQQFAERDRSIDKQFIERDVRTEQTSRDSKVAVDAALQAAKEAVGEQNRSSSRAIQKTETATTKQIEQQALLLTTATRALDDKIDDLKERMTRIEGRGEGSTTTKATSQQMIMVAIALAGVLLAIVSSGIFKGHDTPGAPSSSCSRRPARRAAWVTDTSRDHDHEEALGEAMMNSRSSRWLSAS